MPIKIEYKKDNLGVVTHAEGVVILNDVIESSRRLFSHKNFKNLRYWLMLRDDCNDFSFGLSGMRDIFRLHDEAVKLNPELKVALVPCSESQYVRDILYESHMSLIGGFKTSVFGGVKSAEEWINRSIQHNDL